MSDPASGDASDLEPTAAIRQVARATPPPSDELARVGAALRRLSRWAVTSDDDTPILTTAADALEALASQIADGQSAQPSRPSRFLERSDTPPGARLANARGTHPLLGTVNPVAPPLVLDVEDERIVADVTFDVRFEGNTGWVHGGFVAAGFDIVAVQAARLSGRGGPTGTLSVRYLQPTPIGIPLRYEGWFEGADGRKLRVGARLVRTDDGQTTAEAEAIAVAIP